MSMPSMSIVGTADSPRLKSSRVTPSEAAAEYYARRAAGGASLVIAERVYLEHPSAEVASGQHSVDANHEVMLNTF